MTAAPDEQRSALAPPRPVAPRQRTASVLVRPLQQRRWPLVLRNRTAPFFLALDVLAWAVGTSVLGHGTLLDVALLVGLITALAAGGAYRPRLTLSVLEDWPRLLGRALLAAASVVCLDALISAGGDTEPTIITTGLLVGVLLVALRAGGYALVRDVRRRGLVSHRTVVLGAGRVGGQVMRTLCDHPEYGLDPIGFLDSNPLLTSDQLAAPVLGGNEALAATIGEYDVDTVVVAFGSLKEEQLVEVLRTCDRLECEIFLVPRLFEINPVSSDMDHVWGLPLVRHRRAAFRSTSWHLKRAMDVTVSALALVLLAPLLGALALAVRLEGGPGILFRQTRVGLDNRPFELLKFRSLRPVDDDESATKWSIADDDRVGPVGRLLRKTSLDELPQLWNILRGDMSLVGPRPERPYFVDTFASTLPRYIARHRVPAGLTGWAQVHGLRGNTSIADRARFDNYYIENWSLGLDVRILLMTLVSVVTRSGD